jgi:hypothetical protein
VHTRASEQESWVAGIVFYFENNEVDVWSGREVDLDAWNYACKVAGDIDRAIVINLSDTEVQSFDRAMDIHIVEVRPELPGRVVDVVTPWRSDPDGISLWDFDHAVDWYVFGPAVGHASVGKQIFIPQAGIGAMHSVHAASIVMAHRFETVSRSA